MNFKLVSNYFKVVIACLLGGILLSHYLEPFQIKSFLKIRNMFYFSSATSKEMSDGIVYSKYKGLDSAYFNPVNFVQFVWPEIYTTLSEHVDEKYFLPNDKIVVDTTKLIKFSQKLMEFVDTIFIDDQICYRLIYDFPEKSYSIPQGWYSGMAQGHASELMLSAFCLTNDSIYLRNAEKFINLLNIDIKKGGVKVNVDGGIWFEEYASENNKVDPLVLNGHIFAIDGLYALTQFSKENKYDLLLQRAVNATEANINKYIVAGFWSYYDLFSSPSIADWSYHNIHIQQLDRLIYLNKKLMNKESPEMAFAYNRFRLGKYVPVGIFVRLFLMHNNMLLFMITVNSVILMILYLLIFYCLRRND